MDSSVVLLIDCPDQRGLVARVASLLYEHGANILHADQHEDHALGMFFMRVEFALDPSLDPSGPALAEIERAFAPLAAELGMN